jgi:exodeoxyribonuclease V alpha subunit
VTDESFDLSPLDHEFRRFLERRWHADAQTSGAGAQVSAALREGHTGWLVELPTSGAVAVVDPSTPLAAPRRLPLVQDGPQLALHRVWSTERRVAQSLCARSAEVPQGEPGPKTSVLISALGQGPTPWSELQRQAALLPFARRFTVITGGPGTGKTWVLARLLALQLAAAEDSGREAPRLLLCAPTGKAARRMAEALAKALEGEAFSPYRDSLTAVVPQTLHKVLGLGSPGVPVRHHAQRPLAADVVVVDEASMVDLHLMDLLIQALPPATLLVLLGDSAQLPSVSAGRVLADLVEGFADSGSVIRLTEARRYHADQAIGRAARAMESSDPAGQTLSVLLAPPQDSSSCCLWPGATPTTVFARLRAGFEPFLAATSAPQALALLENFLALTVVNDGPWGQTSLNQKLTESLPPSAPRPILILENDPRTGLSNGDLGVLWTQDGRQQAWFAGSDRPVSPVLLPPWQVAFAITIHKAQGSEFDRILVVLPPAREQGRALLSRELLYTAVTRARSHCTVAGTEAVVESALLTSNLRVSGLATQILRWQEAGV